MIALPLIALFMHSLPVQTDLKAELTSLLDSYESKHFNGFLYMEQDGKPIYFHTVGYANRERKKPFTMSTGIEIGSIVKPISKVALLKLVTAGKLGLDDPITKFFPNVPPDKQEITVRMIAEHRAGFQDVFGDDYDPMKRDELMQKMLESKLLYKPGTGNEYSNSGYSMLATIMEKVTGKPFEEVVAKLEFGPARMKRTGYVLPHWKSSQVACGYKEDGSPWGTPMDHFWFPDGPAWNLRGNGGMITTIPELAKWVRLIHTGKLLTSEEYKIFSPTYASGQNSTKSWNSAGGNGFFDTIVTYNPSRKLAVVAFSSDTRFEIESVIGKQFAKLLYPIAEQQMK